jgi:L-alanine-DL-glutamate epimerase-like enolase superfamily enzyme
MSVSLGLSTRFWPYREPFVLSRGTLLGEDTIQVRLTDEQGRVGRGEAVGVTYGGETPTTMGTQLETLRATIEAGVSRIELLDLLPHGGARAALDSALWDLEAKRGGPDPFRAAGLAPEPVTTMCSIGVKTVEGYAAAAFALADYNIIKVKVDGRDPLPGIEAVHRAAPRAQLLIDPNQGWTVEQLMALAPRLPELNVILLEQPIPVGAERGLDGWVSPVPLCADELIDTAADLAKACGRFDVINIKLDKAGGLTSALRLADAVQALGMDLMVGCMMGSSLSMAPAMVLAQRARFVDLDGPLLHAEDVENGFAYANGFVAQPHRPRLWG